MRDAARAPPPLQVVHLKGGLSSWRYNGYPTESS